MRLGRRKGRSQRTPHGAAAFRKDEARCRRAAGIETEGLWDNYGTLGQRNRYRLSQIVMNNNDDILLFLLRKLVAREGIEPPTRGFSVFFQGFEGLINQSLTALANPLPRHTKAQSWH